MLTLPRRSPLRTTCALHAARKSLRNLCVLAASFLGLLHAAEPAPKRTYAIPAGDATVSLRLFAEQSKQEIIYPAAGVKGVKTNALNGELAPRQALDQLLAGTPLVVTESKSGAMAVSRVTDPKAAGAAPTTPRSDRPASDPTTTVKPAPSPVDDTIILSPFTIAAGTDNGYLATQTLNGTRLRSDIRDIGSAMTIFTEQMMNDLGANSIVDLMAFAPNTDAFIVGTGDTSGAGNDFINNGNQQFVTRGGKSGVVTQNFFGSNVPSDRYNSEGLT